MKVVDAVHIWNGGGRVLLDYLLRKWCTKEDNLHWVLDERMADVASNILPERVTVLAPSIWARRRFYRARGGDLESVLAFGNVPPPVRLACPVFTYFHNVLYINPSHTIGPRKRVVLAVKSAAIRRLKTHTDEWWVQTATMKRMLVQRWGLSRDDVHVYPFFPPLVAPKRGRTSRPVVLYVSDCHPYKQHGVLLEAFEDFNRIVPEAVLKITIGPQCLELLERVEELQGRGVRVENLGWIEAEALAREYEQCGVVVYASVRESFGLGLIEAAQRGLPVVAPDLPYVREVVEPTEVFEPGSSKAVCEALLRAHEGVGRGARLNVADHIDEMWVKFSTGSGADA